MNTYVFVYLHMCADVCLYVCMFKYMYIYMCVYACTCTHMCMCVFIYTSICTCVCVPDIPCICIRTYTHMCIHTCVLACVYICTSYVQGCLRVHTQTQYDSTKDYGKPPLRLRSACRRSASSSRPVAAAAVAAKALPLRAPKPLHECLGASEQGQKWSLSAAAE